MYIGLAVEILKQQAELLEKCGEWGRGRLFAALLDESGVEWDHSLETAIDAAKWRYEAIQTLITYLEDSGCSLPIRNDSTTSQQVEQHLSPQP